MAVPAKQALGVDDEGVRDAAYPVGVEGRTVAIDGDRALDGPLLQEALDGGSVFRAQGDEQRLWTSIGGSQFIEVRDGADAGPAVSAPELEDHVPAGKGILAFRLAGYPFTDLDRRGRLANGWNTHRKLLRGKVLRRCVVVPAAAALGRSYPADLDRVKSPGGGSGQQQVAPRLPPEQGPGLGEVDLLVVLVAGDEEGVEAAAALAHEVEAGQVGPGQVLLVGGHDAGHGRAVRRSMNRSRVDGPVMRKTARFIRNSRAK